MPSKKLDAVEKGLAILGVVTLGLIGYALYEEREKKPQVRGVGSAVSDVEDPARARDVRYAATADELAPLGDQSLAQLKAQLAQEELRERISRAQTVEAEHQAATERRLTARERAAQHKAKVHAAREKALQGEEDPDTLLDYGHGETGSHGFAQAGRIVIGRIG